MALTFAKEKAGSPESSVCPWPPVCFGHSCCSALSPSSLLALCHWVFGRQLTETATFPSAFPVADRRPGDEKHKTVTYTASQVSWKKCLWNKKGQTKNKRTHHVILKSFIGLRWGGAGFDRMLQFCVQVTERRLHLGERIIIKINSISSLNVALTDVIF